MSISPVSTPVTRTVSTATVSSAADGVGASLSLPGEWSHAYIRNTGNHDCEYSLDGGTTWLTLTFKSALYLEYAAGSGGVKVRKSRNTSDASLTIEVYDTSETLVTSDGSVLALTELADPVNLTASGPVRTGASEYCGFHVRVIVGTPQTVTVYNHPSAATGDPIHTQVVTGLGYYPWSGNKVRPCSLGVYATITGGTSRTIEFL